MNLSIIRYFRWSATIAVAVMLTACSEEQPPQVQAPLSQDEQTPRAAADAATTQQQAGVTTQSDYSAEALESLLAPVALYPDPVLAQVLASSTNPQEVLDAGNWLVENPDLTGDALSQAASAVGFTPPMLALIQFPTVVDMMCMEMDWTTELGTAFLTDEPGVLSAVQRLRQQAADVGNLQDSEQMTVSTQTVNNQEVIVVQPANPEVVYVPQYDPTVVYTTPPPAVSTTTVTTVDEGYSTGELVTTGLLAFGAGILVNEIFDDDDDDYYYAPRWGYGYGGPAYYPPPYRPRYGNGYRPAHRYNRPPNYQHGFNNNNIYVNTDGKNYFNRFESGRHNYRNKPDSPITAARADRSELGSLKRQSTEKPTLKGSYAGAQPGARPAVAQQPRKVVKPPTGSYAGATPAARQKLNAKTAGERDRGHSPVAVAKPGALQKTTSRPAGGSGFAAKRAESKRPTAFQGSRHSGSLERAASKRGRASMKNSSNRSGGLKRGRK